MNSDEELMTLALEVAASADFRQSPNPMVGCVIARNGKVIATSAHLYAGDSHAEILALKKAGDVAKGADVFITLEPCSIHGRTPPCVDEVIAVRPARVVVAMLDPNPKVNGKGVEALRRAGINVVLGIKESDARQLNQFYIKYINSGKPFVTAKFAASLDGRIATRTGESKWITNQESRARTHRLRNEHDGVMVGIGTVLADDPALTARFDGARQPMRVVVDSHLRLPDQAQLLRQPKGLIVATSDTVIEEQLQRIQTLRAAGVEVWGLASTPDGRVNLEALLLALGQKELTSLLVEGGATLLGSLFDYGLVDRVIAFIAPRIIGGQASLAAVGGQGVSSPIEASLLQNINVELSGTDIVVSGSLAVPPEIKGK